MLYASSSAAICQTWENCLLPEATRDRAYRAAHVREWLPLLAPPLENYGAMRELVKNASKLPPAEPFTTGIYARPNIANGSATVKDPSLPQAGPFTARFNVLIVLAHSHRLND
jgi:hypothetical protein